MEKLHPDPCCHDITDRTVESILRPETDHSGPTATGTAAGRHPNHRLESLRIAGIVRDPVAARKEGAGFIFPSSRTDRENPGEKQVR